MAKRKYYTYIIQANEHIKIGYTSHLDRRMEQLQIGNALELELLETFLHPTADAAEKHEAKLHRRFSRHRVRGEWFQAKPVRRYLRRKKYRWWLWLL